MENKGLECIKYLMFFANLLIFIGGIVVLAIGIKTYVSGSALQGITSSSSAFQHAMIVVIIVGGILIVAGFFGCCGAIKEDRCLLGTFFSVVLVLFLVQLAVIIVVFVFYPKAEKFALDSIANIDVTDPTSKMLKAWNTLQSKLKCCGLKGPSDWHNGIPGSCCGSTTNTCSSESSDIYEKGCKPELKHFFWVIGGATIAVVVFEFLAMIFSCCLYKEIGKYETLA